MPFAEHFMLQGTFTAPATLPGRVNLNLGFIPTKVELINRTKLGDNGAANIQRVTWNNDFGTTNTMIEYITSGSTTMNVANLTSNGISPYDGTQSVLYGAAQTGTVITKANPAVVTATTHGLQTGDIIRITNNEVMTQLGGLNFTVTVTDANTFTIPINTNTANFTTETGFTFRRLSVGPLYYPNRSSISNITAANPIVVTTLTAHGLTVGQQVRLIVPRQFAMTQANFLQGVITAVTSTTLTIGSIDSSAFTAWAWPATTSVPFTPAQVVPIGSGPSPITLGLVTYYQDGLDDATMNQQFQGITIGTGILQSTGTYVIAASDVFSYTAWRGDV